MSESYKQQMLKSSLEARLNEVVEYDVNITNFELAIEKVGDDIDLQEFKQHLSALLASSLVERKKAQIMLDVIKSQLTD